MVVTRDAVDAGTLADVELGYHLPPFELRDGVIVDVGCHAGFTLVSFAERFPGRELVGVELDAGNAHAARANTAGLAGVRVIEAGIDGWDGRCRYESGLASNAFSISAMDGPVACMRLSTLLAREHLERVAFLKLDIEGSEAAVVQDARAWADKVDALTVECHAGYTHEECADALFALGYDTQIITYPRRDDGYRHRVVAGRRP